MAATSTARERDSQRLRTDSTIAVAAAAAVGVMLQVSGPGVFLPPVPLIALRYLAFDRLFTPGPQHAYRVQAGKGGR